MKGELLTRWLPEAEDEEEEEEKEEEKEEKEEARTFSTVQYSFDFVDAGPRNWPTRE